MTELLPGVSVVIPCHNQAPTLTAAVYSTLRAGANEVVIINDGSLDNSESTARLLLREPNVFLTSHQWPAFGVCWARNVGIQLARHEWILPLDADDELLPTGIEALHEHRHYGCAVYGDYLIDDAQVSNAPPHMIDRKSICHATLLFHKHDWQRVGGYKPEFNVGCEDWDFALSLVDAGVNLSHVNAPIYRRTVSANGRAAKCLARKPLITALLKEYHPRLQLS